MTVAPGLAPATVASARTGRTLRIDSARGGPAPQVVIDHLMDVRGGDLGAGDRVIVIRPAYGVYLPDTAATVTVWGGSVCRTSDRCRGGFEVRAGARLVARGAARVRVRSGGAVDIYDDAAGGCAPTAARPSTRGRGRGCAPTRAHGCGSWASASP